MWRSCSRLRSAYAHLGNAKSVSRYAADEIH